VLTLDRAASPASELPELDFSQIATHNAERHGYWLVIDRFVYDVSAFMHAHPGGDRILQLYAGRDASHGFARVHKNHRGVALRMDRYRIGVLREIACDAEPEHATHLAPYRAFRDALDLLVEMQNALAADHSFQLEREAEQTSTSRYELQRKLETHVRFQREYIEVLVGDTFARLVASITPACAELPPLRAALEALQGSTHASAARDRALEALEQFEDLPGESIAALSARYEASDRSLLSALKRQLSCGVRVFERAHPAALPMRARMRLHAACKGVIAHTNEYFERP
jgi:hypothetical protein